MGTKKILFINFGGLGDEILFLPTILSVKKEFPESEITLALEERSKSITSLTNVIDNTIFANIKRRKLCKHIEMLKLLFKIRQDKFDLVISTGGNKFISIFLFLTGIRERYGYDTGFLSKILLTKAIPLNKKQYAVNMYHDIVQHVTKNKTELPILNIEKREVIPNSVLVHPGVSQLSLKNGMIKTITPNQWAKVIEALSDTGKNVMLIGGPEDKDCIETIVNQVSPYKFENLYGSTKNVRELAELISSSEKFLCSDSAPLHIAVSLGVKTYVIFGSTDDKKLIPQNELVVPIKNNYECPLRPCLWEKRQTSCKELGCLQFTTEEIVKTVLEK